MLVLLMHSFVIFPNTALEHYIKSKNRLKKNRFIAFISTSKIGKSTIGGTLPSAITGMHPAPRVSCLYPPP